MLELELNDVELWEGSTKTFTFALNNYAPERFYIDKVNAFDFEEGILTEELSWQGVALSQEQATIRVSIRAESSAEERERKAKIELRGHFLGGKECKYSDVFGEFSVNVLKKPVHRIEARCEGFSLYTLSEKFIEGFGEIEFIAVNKTNYPAVIKLESNKLGINDTIFYVPAGEEKLFKTEIQSAVEKAELVYKIELSDCGIPSEKTIVYSSVFEEPTPEPVEFRGIELNVSTARDENGFLATISIYNPNDVKIEGVLEVLVPENWQVIGEGSVTIEEFTEIIAAVRIVPPEGFTGKYSGEIVFSYNGLMEKQPIELEFGEQGFDVIASALAGLGSSAIAIGLIIVIVILVVVLVSAPPRQKDQPWVEATK